MGSPRIYLDNAATSWPKPEGVYAAVDSYQRQLGAPAGRGAYREAMEVDRRVQQARHALARLIDAPEAERVVFTYSGTDSLTLALRGLVKPGDHVVTSVCEHNSVLRPLRYLEVHHEVLVTRIGCDAAGIIDPDEVARAALGNRQTRLVALVHASNVTGAIQPIEEVADRLAGSAVRLLVDAAQSIGHRRVNVSQLRCDLLAAPGHKGLLGPTGTGFLYLAPGVEKEVQPQRLGGTGTRSESDEVPEELPHRYEAGNHNVPGILGLAAGIEFLNERGIEQLEEHERRLTRRLLDGLSDMSHVKRFGPADVSHRVGVVSFQVANHDPQEVAVLLDQIAGIQTRAGFHCAPRMHQALGTSQLGGTVRVSCGPFNESSEIDAVVETLRHLG
jgi:cysteine desulfurase family protein